MNLTTILIEPNGSLTIEQRPEVTPGKLLVIVEFDGDGEATGKRFYRHLSVSHGVQVLARE